MDMLRFSADAVDVLHCPADGVWYLSGVPLCTERTRFVC